MASKQNQTNNVTKRVKCEYCNGKGLIPKNDGTRGMTSCETCRGRGWSYQNADLPNTCW